ncbi:MAG: dehydrogenase, partial [Thermoleophilia bacterium]|nr:dehydrogenase [Thermoleophilia bacterium]
MTSFQLKPGTAFSDVYDRARAIAPEAFDAFGIRNLIEGEWVAVGDVREHRSPVDGSIIPGPPLVDRATAERAVKFALDEHDTWSQTELAERKEKVVAALDLLTEHREVLSLLIVWEIGKPWRLATTDVDRAIEGVRWYVEQIDRQLEGRVPLDGPVSNIASWNYPMSVQVHAELVQLLAGNAVVAKTPTQGGFHALTLAHALMRRVGLPVSLISGAGGTVGDVLVGASGIGAVSFVGGRANGREVAIKLEGSDRRHMLEEEGLNAWGIWDFSDWDSLAAHIRKGFEYGKQRCTAYPRFVVQRSLFARFLEAYEPVLQTLKFGHPLAVEHPDDELPELDFGPLISAKKASEVTNRFDEAVSRGGIPLVRRSLGEGRFLE